MKKKKSIRRAHGQFVSDLNYMTSAHKHGSAAEEAALQELLKIIRQDISVFEAKVKTKESNGRRLEESSIGIAAVRWAISKNLTQQGLTALETTIITYVGELCRFDSDQHLRQIADINRYEGRECLSKALLGRNDSNPNIQQRINQAKPVIQNRFSTPDYNKLKNCCGDVKKARNSINHFGLTDQGNGYTYEDLNSILRVQFNVFLECVDRYCTCTNGNQSILGWRSMGEDGVI